MFNPVRDKEKEAWSIVKNQALKGINKELNKLNKQIKTTSDYLLFMDNQNSTIKTRSNIRTKLALMCEEKDRYEKAIELLNG